jgi:hypothetical protein
METDSCIAASKVLTTSNFSFFNGYVAYANQTLGIDYYKDMSLSRNELNQLYLRLR